MANIICSTAGCGADLGNLCEEVVVLFNMKADILMDKPDGGEARAFAMSVKQIDLKLEKELGLQGHQELFAGFLQEREEGLRRTSEVRSQTKTFIVTCFNKHKNQYILNCP